MRPTPKLLSAAAPFALALGIVTLPLIPAPAAAEDKPCDYQPGNAGPDNTYGNADDVPATLICGEGFFVGPGETILGTGIVSAGGVAIGQSVIVEGDGGADADFFNKAPIPNASVGIGYRTRVDGDRNVAVGGNARIGGVNGDFNSVNDATAIGSTTLVLGDRATAVGAFAQALDYGATALGMNARATELYATATGYNARAAGAGTTATGYFSLAAGLTSTAMGAVSFAGGFGAEDPGGNWVIDPASPQNDRTTALGALARAGTLAAGQTDATAVGYDARANALKASAFGANSRADVANSVALGEGSVAERERSVSVGTAGFERQITNVAAGTQATDAVNKAQLDVVEAKADAAQITANSALTAAGTAAGSATAAQVTADAAIANAAAAQTTANTARAEAGAAQTTANTARTEAGAAQATANTAIAHNAQTGASTAAALGGGSTYNTATGAISAPSYSVGGQSYNNVGAALTALDTGLSAIGGRIDSAFDLMEHNRREARRGIAAAVAMSPAPFPSAPGRTSYTANTAVYRGEVAVSASLAHRLNTEAPFAITAGISHAGGRDTAVRAGIAGEF